MPHSTVVTQQVSGRRLLSFASLEAMLADAEQLVASPQTRMLGNWPLDRLLMHLTNAVNGSIDGIPEKGPWAMRVVGRLIKGRILRKGLSPEFNLPKNREQQFFPEGGSPQQAVEKFRAAVERTKLERMTAAHPIFGTLTHEEWTQLHLRHAEMHLSFAVRE
jgi:hypothetical protein